MDAVAVVDIWTPELITHPLLLIAITDHLEPCLAHWVSLLSLDDQILLYLHGGTILFIMAIV